MDEIEAKIKEKVKGNDTSSKAKEVVEAE